MCQLRGGFVLSYLLLIFAYMGNCITIAGVNECGVVMETRPEILMEYVSKGRTKSQAIELCQKYSDNLNKYLNRIRPGTTKEQLTERRNLWLTVEMMLNEK